MSKDHKKERKEKKSKERSEEKEKKKSVEAEETQEEEPTKMEQGEEQQEDGNGKEEQESGALVTRIDLETAEYFRQLEGVLEANQFETEEDRAVFIENVLAEVLNKEARMTMDRRCSKFLEKLMKLAPADKFALVLNNLLKPEVFAELVFNPYSSHVLQSIFYMTPNVATWEESSGLAGPKAKKEKGEERVTVYQSLLDLSSHLCTDPDINYVSLMQNACGSHVVRALLGALGGRVPVLELEVLGRRNRTRTPKHQQDRSKDKEQFETVSTPSAFPLALVSIAEYLSGQSPSRLSFLSQDSYASPCLQTFLTLLHSHSIPPMSSEAHRVRLDLLIRRLLMLDSGVSNDQVWQLVQSQTGSHLVELVLQTCSDETYLRLISACFKGRLSDLSMHGVGNYVVQKLLTCARDAPQVNILVEELEPSIRELLVRSRVNVVVKMAEACATHKAAQKKLLKSLCSAVHAAENRRLVAHLLLLDQVTNEIRNGAPENSLDLTGFEGSSFRYSQAGIALLQAVLKFEVESVRVHLEQVRSLPPFVLCQVATTAVGSRLVESFLDSVASSSAKLKFVDAFKGFFADLAMDKFGGFCVEKLFKQADVGRKEAICLELLPKQHEILSFPHGKFVLRACKLDEFKRKKSEWSATYTKADKTRERFRDILEDENDGGKKGKKKKEKDSVDLSEGMTVLGFGSAYSQEQDEGEETGAGHKTEKKNKDKKKEKKKKESVNVAGGEEEELRAGKSAKELEAAYDRRDEIDDIFKHKNRNKGEGKGKDKGEKEGEEEKEEKKKEKKGKEAVGSDLSQVLDAITATTRKGNKKLKRKHEEEELEEATKPSKKQKKFMMA